MVSVSLCMSYGIRVSSFRKLLYPIGSTLNPKEDNKGAKLGQNTHCMYHRRNVHRTDDYCRLNHLIHIMIEDGMLPILSNKTLKKIEVADMRTRDYLKLRWAQTPLKMIYTQIFHNLRAKSAISPIRVWESKKRRGEKAGEVGRQFVSTNKHSPMQIVVPWR